MENNEKNDEANFDYNQRFGGVARLYGKEGLLKLKHSHLLIIGLGGVGTWAAEALARSGVGAMTLVDLDDICITNTNRQIHATDGLYGVNKTKALKERILTINPYCIINTIEDFFTEDTAEKILEIKFDYVIDAIDSLLNKCLLICKCKEKNLPLVTVGGAAGKKNPNQIKVTDLGLACNDSLLSSVRKKLRQDHGYLSGKNFTRNKKQIFNVFCVYSEEKALLPENENLNCGTNETKDFKTGLRMDCEGGLGSATHTTGTFGFMAASFVIDQITKK